MSTIEGILVAIIPSAAVLGIFIFVMRQIMRADRKEREAIARFEAEHAAEASKGSGER